MSAKTIISSEGGKKIFNLVSVRLHWFVLGKTMAKGQE